MAPKITADDAHVAWSAPAYAVDRQIRAVTPAPGAWSTLRGQRVKLGPVTPDRSAERLAPGLLRMTGDGVLAGTATDPVRLGLVQPAGKRSMPAPDWLRGLRPALAADETDGEYLQ